MARIVERHAPFPGNVSRPVLDEEEGDVNAGDASAAATPTNRGAPQTPASPSARRNVPRHTAAPAGQGPSSPVVLEEDAEGEDGSVYSAGDEEEEEG